MNIKDISMILSKYSANKELFSEKLVKDIR